MGYVKRTDASKRAAGTHGTPLITDGSVLNGALSEGLASGSAASAVKARYGGWSRAAESIRQKKLAQRSLIQWSLFPPTETDRPPDWSGLVELVSGWVAALVTGHDPDTPQIESGMHYARICARRGSSQAGATRCGAVWRGVARRGFTDVVNPAQICGDCGTRSNFIQCGPDGKSAAAIIY